MHEVAETAAIAFAVLILSAASFAEIRDGREFGI
jgi:hypothetical protein